MADSTAPDRSLVISYLVLRRAIGILGLSLPFVLVLGKTIFQGPGLETSMSRYYYTVAGDFFVGSLCAIGVFLLSYKGYERTDDLAGDLACVFAVGVALFPTSPENPTSLQRWIGVLHYAAAAGMFGTLAFFSLVLFRKTDCVGKMPLRKRQRNVVYTACGFTILGCIALLAALAFAPQDAPVRAWRPVFWLEAIAVVAFGISWITKGETILKDL